MTLDQKLLAMALINALVMGVNAWLCFRNQRISQANEQILRELEHARGIREREP